MPSEDSTKETAEPGGRKTAIAHKLAAKQQEISVTEFFEKNKQILGFDSRSKSLLMGIKEAVDNSLDACEEAGILPDVSVRIDRLNDEDYCICIEDNGPGIVHKMMPNVFGRLLYGSRFHALRQSRGQQGIGISATVMYGNITTGKPAHVMSKIEGEDEVAWGMDIVIDTKTNRPIVTNDKAFEWEGKEHGTSIEYTIKGRYITGKQSVFEYLRDTAIVNPHAQITFRDPEGKRYVFERATDIMPPKPKEIKPHPEGMEIGDILKYASNTQQKTLKAFLKNDFSRITDRIATEICERSGVNPDKSPAKVDREDAIRILKAIGEVKIMAPPTDCLSPIGDTLIKKGLMHVLEGLRPEYYATPVTRSPKAVNGNPFIVEAGIVYGGDIPSDGQVQILRFANRVPAEGRAYPSDPRSSSCTWRPPRSRSHRRARRPSPPTPSSYPRSAWRSGCAPGTSRAISTRWRGRRRPTPSSRSCRRSCPTWRRRPRTTSAGRCRTWTGPSRGS